MFDQILPSFPLYSFRKEDRDERGWLLGGGGEGMFLNFALISSVSFREDGRGGRGWWWWWGGGYILSDFGLISSASFSPKRRWGGGGGESFDKILL